MSQKTKNISSVDKKLMKLMSNYITFFNSIDSEMYSQYISNSEAFNFLEKNIPFFECPDKEIEQTYYFRWWTYRKHIKKTEEGFVITEFLPKVPWAGKHNTISASAGHHIYEGRWLRDRKYLNDYATFWFKNGGTPCTYSLWIADAIHAYYLVSHSKNLADKLLDDLIRNYEHWEIGWNHTYRGEHYHIGRHNNGAFFQVDDRDAEEHSISGHGYRPTLNSYMYGDALAISKIAFLMNQKSLADMFAKKAADLKKTILNILWDRKNCFFQVLSEKTNRLADVRELLGYTPWYFNIPDNGYEKAWLQLMDKDGFYSPFGPTTAEQRHPEFCSEHEGQSIDCYWDGPSWPFETSKCLTAMANLLCNYDQNIITKEDYFTILKIYSKSHKLKSSGSETIPWIDENLNPFTGEWQTRKNRMEYFKAKGYSDPFKERGKDYNHSTYCDLIISGLVGLRPQGNDSFMLNPLLPKDKWDWFCLSNVPYHNHLITILWDRTGNKYNMGSGLRVFVDNIEVRFSKNLQLLHIPLTGQY